jgi:hypothetical protein
MPISIEAARTTPDMMEAETTMSPKKKRATWTQADLTKLIQTYSLLGAAAAREAFPDRDVTAKLVSLGLLQLNEHDRDIIDQFVATYEDAPLAMRYLKSRVNAKGTP